ncbi:high mobility group B protein 15 isoform X2 [Diospyros lotus]|uniref:high mobility group B protein 15 isoform X2 n=1 Tax=Diospyros lotus TaxID=55363 RepID=UPI002257DD14|nr:high mobility group B protein 15 isoform X2 [Diospyros lotus]
MLGRTEEGGSGRGTLAMASSSAASNNSTPKREAVQKYLPYPPPLARYEDVVVSPKLFMDTLEKLHATMGTKFMIPIIGGKDLDLHRLFVEVTSRGGIQKILRERRWKEVTAVFNFPSTATNASFVLRKYYVLLLYHYEQIYFFKAKGWSPLADPLQCLSSPPVPPQGLIEPSPEIQAAMMLPQVANAAEFLNRATSVPSTGSPVIGVIDGKFESGYLVTVTIGSEKLKGVLYQAPQNPTHQVVQHNVPQHQIVSFSNVNNNPTAPGILRRRRRKKSEMKKRDPAHPKPNRSGYNFFFAEQHARLKPLYPGKDREISRTIGELWTKMKESEKAVYQDKAVMDKERYRAEMEDYRERLRTGQIISNAVPIQQRPLEPDVNLVDIICKKIEPAHQESPKTLENQIGSGKSCNSDSEDKDSYMETYPGEEVGAENMVMEYSAAADEECLELQKRIDKVGHESLLSSGDTGMIVESKQELAPEGDKGSMACDTTESLPTEQREAVLSEAKASMHGESC